MSPTVINDIAGDSFMMITAADLIRENNSSPLSESEFFNNMSLAHAISSSLTGTNAPPSPEFNASAQCIASDPNMPLFSFVITGILTGIICIVGLIGNFLSSIVLTKTQLSVSVNLLLLALTFCDTIVIIYSFLTFVLPPWFGYFDTGYWYIHNAFPLMAPFLLPLGHFGRTGSFYFTVAVTIERFIVVCWPLRAKSLCTNRHTIYYTASVFFFTALYTLPRWFEVHTIEITDVDLQTNHSTLICYALRPTALAMNGTYRFCSRIIYLLVMGILPFTVLAIPNYFIYRELKWSRKTRQSITGTQLTENSIALMLLFVVVVFFLCALPATVLTMLELFTVIQRYRPLTDLSTFLVTVNSCANFAIYYLCGQKFRSNFAMIWNQYCSCCPLLDFGIASSNSNSKSNIKSECEMI